MCFTNYDKIALKVVRILFVDWISSNLYSVLWPNVKESLEILTQIIFYIQCVPKKKVISV